MIVFASEPPHLEIVHHLVQMERQMACQNGIILGRLGGEALGGGPWSQGPGYLYDIITI